MRIYGSNPNSHIPYRYTGKEWDPEIGLYYFRARFYDPSIGRFYQIDTKSQYFNPYKYSGNLPISMIDPSGEIAFTLISLMVAFAIGGLYLDGAAANNSFNIRKWKWNKQTMLELFLVL